MADKLRVGLIGMGGIANLHAGGWAAVENAELVAGSDVNTAVFPRWQKEYGLSYVAVNPDDILHDPEIDIIDICTPNNYHADLAIRAMEAGKHVLCEKPLASTPAEIRRMIEARDRTGMMLMTAQHHRFSGVSKALKAEIDAGALGDVYHARSWMLRRAAVPTRPGFIMKQHSGGGPTVDIGVHILDLTLWFMGSPRAVSVTGVARAELVHQPGAFSIWGTAAIPPEYDVEDFAAAFVRFDNGATLMLEVSWMLHHPVDGYEDMQMWLYGTKGGAHWPKCEIYQSNNETKQHYNRQLLLKPEPQRPHFQEIIEFAQAVASGGRSPVPAEQSLQVSLILEAIYKSQETKREVVIEY
jgi:predicted dehydrogenase